LHVSAVLRPANRIQAGQSRGKWPRHRACRLLKRPLKVDHQGMNRPTEQLIRDYLNRLSLAAKIRLEPADRQALLDHTRARIDAECDGATNPTAAQVRRTLAGLGDPIALVERERSRVAARKAWDTEAPSGTPAGGSVGAPRDMAAGSRATGSPRQVWPQPASPVNARRPLMPPPILPPATANAQVSAVRPVTAATSSFSPAAPGHPVPAGAPLPAVAAGGPVPPGTPAPAGDVPPGTEVSAGNGAWARPLVSPGQVAAANGLPAPPDPGEPPARAHAAAPDDPPDRPRPARPTSPSAPRGLPPLRGVPAPRGVPPASNSPAAGDEPAPPGGAGRGAGGSAGSNGLSQRPPAPRPAPDAGQVPPGAAEPAKTQDARAAGPDRDQGAASRTDEDVPGVEFSIDQTEVEVQPSRLAEAGGAVWRGLNRVGSALLAIARRDRLEAISLVLLGIGGPIYPAIWLIGACIAVASKKWDLRDKWLGLAVPVLAVMLGTALEITFGAHLSGYWPYFVEAWLTAGRLSRVAAALGALYLLWRVHRYGGSRTRRLPPWSPPRKPGR
jgi:hypothetical protein